MFDELERLQESAELFRLLDHYVRLGAADREAWHDRLMAAAGLTPRDLTQLHGELLAHGWVEQNTGVTPPGVTAHYRATAAGRRAVQQARQDQPRAA